MNNKEYICDLKKNELIRTMYQKDALEWLIGVNKNIEKVSKEIPKMADKLLDINSANLDIDLIYKSIKQLKEGVICLQNIVNFSPRKEEKRIEELEKEIDFPIFLDVDNDGFYFVKFDFDLPVIRHPFTQNERVNLKKTIWNLDDLPLINDLFLFFEFHQGTEKKYADYKEIGNRDIKLITDILVSKYSKNGDNGSHYMELRRSVLDGNYFTKVYLLEQKNAINFMKNHL